MAKRFDPQREFDGDGRLVSKVCSACGERRLAADFCNRTLGPHGKGPECRGCATERYRRRRAVARAEAPGSRTGLMTGATFRAVHEAWPMLPAASGLAGFCRRYGWQYG